jgi:hypothetical protein
MRAARSVCRCKSVDAGSVDDRLLSFDMRGVFAFCTSTVSFPAFVFALFEFFGTLPATLRVCVFHRGVVLLNCLFVCVQVLFTQSSSNYAGLTSSFIANFLSLLVGLVHVWESLVVSVYFCGTRVLEPVALLLVSRFLRTAWLCATQGVAVSAFSVWVVFHFCVDAALLSWMWDSRLGENVMIGSSLSTLVFCVEMGLLIPAHQCVFVPVFARDQIVLGLEPLNSNPLIATVNRRNNATRGVGSNRAARRNPLLSAR